MHEAKTQVDPEVLALPLAANQPQSRGAERVCQEEEVASQDWSARKGAALEHGKGIRYRAKRVLELEAVWLRKQNFKTMRASVRACVRACVLARVCVCVRVCVCDVVAT